MENYAEANSPGVTMLYEIKYTDSKPLDHEISFLKHEQRAHTWNASL